MAGKRAGCMLISFSTFKDAVLKEDTRQKTADLLADLEKQLGTMPIMICGEAPSRARSPYQEFMSTCMKHGTSLQDCAGEWRTKKSNG